ncbi:MAG TPA: hypothetical protein VFE53_23085 [Mucilaginibacter sp.]|jgi:hypothetical protein|nr:hypothetical protein [Mucilaginibacter sp.]
MKFLLSLFLLLALAGRDVVHAQSIYETADDTLPNFNDFIVIRPRMMQPISDIYGVKVASLGANLGYGVVFNNRHWGADVTVFGDLLGSEFDFAPNKYLATNTLNTGLSINPYYVINPEAVYFQISFSLSVNPGYNFGWEGVYLKGAAGSDDKQLESNYAPGGFGITFSPAVSIGFKGTQGTGGVEFGFSSSDFGAGLVNLSSKYYRPLAYNWGYLFVSVFFRLNQLDLGALFRRYDD